MPYLEIQLTKKLERIYDLSGETFVGRAPECRVQLLSRAVSRRHAKFQLAGELTVLHDLGGANGVKVNGVRVKGTQNLVEGDKIIVGDVPMTFRAASRVLASDDSIDARGMDVPEERLRSHLTRAKAAFTLPVDPTYLSNFQATLAKERIDRLPLSDEARLKLQIALAEAIENAVQHGARGDPSKPIQVLFEESPEDFRMSVRDLGPGFDFEKVLANVEEIDSLAVIREREAFGTGLGLRMILDCVDRVQFESGSPGVTVHMAKYLDEDAGMIVVEDEHPDPDGSNE